MPDPAMTDALAEAAALAPDDEVFWETIEFRHPSFVDENGDPDSLRLVANTEDLVAPLEADAPIKGGQYVTFHKSAFSGALRPAIEPGATPEIEITIDNVNRAIMEYLDLAMAAAVPLVMAYRIYLDTAIEDGPQRDPVDTFEVSEVTVGVNSVTVKARTGIDLRGAFPVRTYDINSFPGLAGR